MYVFQGLAIEPRVSGNDLFLSYAVGELTCVQVLDTVHFSAGENSSWNLYSGRIAGQAAAASLEK